MTDDRADIAEDYDRMFDHEDRKLDALREENARLRALAQEFVTWEEDELEVWEEHGEPVPPGKHPRHIQCINPKDLVWLEAFGVRIRVALAQNRSSEATDAAN